MSEPSRPLSENPLDYWINNNNGLVSKFKNVAMEILCVPASSASVERLFSKCGLSCLGRRNRLTDKNLRMEVVIKSNTKIIDKILKL